MEGVGVGGEREGREVSTTKARFESSTVVSWDSPTVGLYTRTLECMKQTAACIHPPLSHERASSISMKLVILVIIVIFLLYLKLLPSSCTSSLLVKIMHFLHYSFSIRNNCKIGYKQTCSIDSFLHPYTHCHVAITLASL